MVSIGSRGEKLSTIKLTFVQYGILLMMLGLAAGLCRRTDSLKARCSD